MKRLLVVVIDPDTVHKDHTAEEAAELITTAWGEYDGPDILSAFWVEVTEEK